MNMNRVSNSLLDDLAADLAPVQPIRLWQGIALLALSALATVALVELIDGLWRSIAAGRASDMFFIANGMFALVGAAATFAVIKMASPHVGNRHDGARWATGTIVLLPLTAVLTLGLFGAFDQIASDPRGLSCFRRGNGLRVARERRPGRLVTARCPGLAQLRRTLYRHRCRLDRDVRLWSLVPDRHGGASGELACPADRRLGHRRSPDRPDARAVVS